MDNETYCELSIQFVIDVQGMPIGAITSILVLIVSDFCSDKLARKPVINIPIADASTKILVPKIVFRILTSTTPFPGFYLPCVPGAVVLIWAVVLSPLLPQLQVAAAGMAVDPLAQEEEQGMADSCNQEEQQDPLGQQLPETKPSLGFRLHKAHPPILEAA